MERSQERPSTGRRIPGVEGLRALAATAVVGVHVWYVGNRLPVEHARLNGVASQLTLGVTLFFCLSGFLLYGPFARALLEGSPRPSTRAYLRNRALRIVPAYWAVLLVAGVGLGLLTRSFAGGQDDVGRITDPFRLVQQATLTHQWHPSAAWTGLMPAWTLSVEVVFYLVLPFLALAAARLAHRIPVRAAVLAPAAGLLVAGLAGKAVARWAVPGLPFTPTWHSVLEASFLAQCDLFAFGMVLAVIRVEVLGGRLAIAPRTRTLLLPAAVALLVGSMWGLGSTGQLTASAWNTTAALAIAALMALVVLPRPGADTSRVVRFLEWPAVAGMGVVSYGVFLWHQPIVDALRLHDLLAHGLAGGAVNYAVVLLLAAAVAALSHRFVEAPALRRKRRTVAAPAPLPLVRRPERVVGLVLAEERDHRADVLREARAAQAVAPEDR
jgi:peptidoglycan/LPS O-acetylase OafA/YrhL